eukprot:s2948_g4.t1
MFCACCEVEEQGIAMEVSPVPVIEEEVPKRPAAAPAEVALKAAPTSGIFTVEIPLPGSKPAQLGLDLDAIDSKGPIIVGIMPGVLKDFNDANPALSLEAYDRIEAVNGETGEPSKLYKAMTSAVEDLTKGKFTLKICRPRKFTASITKTGEPLGTQLNFKVSSAGIVVTRVSHGGLISKHNEQNPSSQILPGDRVGAVNGSHLKGGAMVDSLKKEPNLNLTVYRYDE